MSTVVVGQKRIYIYIYFLKGSKRTFNDMKRNICLEYCEVKGKYMEIKEQYDYVSS